MQHIQIRLAKKFQLKQTTLMFWKIFTQKGYFGSKTEKGIIFIINSIIKRGREMPK